MIKQYIPSIDIFKGLGSDWKKNSVWIEITPKRLKSTSNQKTSTVTLSNGKDSDLVQYIFLAPRDTMETANHTWEPLENISSTVSGKIAGLFTTVTQGNTVYKVDTPLLYKDSQRRTLSFQFHLIYTGKTNSFNNVSTTEDIGPYREVILPVKNMLKWSSPSLGDPTIKASVIDIPYVFTIKTMTGDGKDVDLFNMKAAALTSVQPTFSQPYVMGYPSKAELTLTFTDIEPLNRLKNLNRNIRIIG